MRISRVYTGDDGRSHFEEIEIAFPEDAGIGRRTPLLPADSISMREAEDDNIPHAGEVQIGPPPF